MPKSFAARLSLVFFLASSLVLGAVFTFFYFKATKLRDDAFREYLEHLTAVSATLISGKDVLAVPLTEGCDRTPEGHFMIRKLQSIRAVDRDIFDAYLMVADPDPGYVRFVTNADRERTPVACGERYDIRNDPAILSGFDGPVAELKANTDRWGTWVSAYAPIRTRDGKIVAVLGLDIEQQTVDGIRREFFSLFLVSIGACLVFSLAIGLLSSTGLTRPIRRIIDGMEIVSKGDLDHVLARFPEVEFNRISQIFNKMTSSLKRMMIELERNVRERESARKELEIASEIQRSIFPEHPPEVEGLEIEAKSVPAKEVGGDYYDFFQDFVDGRTGFVIADASGKGLPGTLYMTRARSFLKAISSGETHPGAVLTRANEQIATDTSSSNGMFITALYLLYDSGTKVMTCANGGHYPPLWYKSREKVFSEPAVSGIPIGILPGQTYAEETLALAPGDLLVLYTDGVIEAHSEEGAMFGVERLKRLIEENSFLGARDLFARIEAGIHDFTGKAPPFDDLTLIVIRVT